MERNLADLSPHPINDKVYHVNLKDDFLKSIEKKGILNPIVITEGGLILSGHSRYAAAKELGFSSVPVYVCPIEDELDIREFVIESNRQREKTNEEKAREYKELARIEEEKAQLVQSHDVSGILKEDSASAETDADDATDIASMPKVKEGQNSRKIAASKLKMRGKTAERSEKVVDVIDQLEVEGKEEEAKELRETLNKKSIQKALEVATRKGLLDEEVLEEDTPKKKPKYFKVPTDNAQGTSEVLIENFSRECLQELTQLLNQALHFE